MGAVAGCSADEVAVEEVSVASEVATEEATEESAEEVEEISLSVGQVELNGVVLEIGQNVTDETIAELGEPLETLEAPSCHYDGNDTIYYYDDFVLYVYQDGEDTPLYIIELDTDQVATREGVRVEMTSDEVIEILGDGCTLEGTFLTFTEDGITTDCFLDDTGSVWYIEVF